MSLKVSVRGNRVEVLCLRLQARSHPVGQAPFGSWFFARIGSCYDLRVAQALARDRLVSCHPPSPSQWSAIYRFPLFFGRPLCPSDDHALVQSTRRKAIMWLSMRPALDFVRTSVSASESGTVRVRVR